MGLESKPLAGNAAVDRSTDVRFVHSDELPDFRIFVSSPGDVSTERKIAERIIGRLGGEFRERGRLDPYFWEYEPMRHQNDFQVQIPPTSDFDVVICILWSRLGTPVTAEDGTYYSSGTEYEVTSAWAAWQATGRPELLIYINETPAQIRQFPDSEFDKMVEQLKALKKFIGEYCIDPETGRTKGAFTAYQDLGQFEHLLEKHLAKLIDKAFPKKSFQGAPIQALPATWTGRSPYRGLEPFDFEHAPIFFGRTRAVGEVLARLRKRMAEVEDAKASRSTGSEMKPAAFVLVSAMSGVGKSSLVRAGILPLLVEPGNGVALWRHTVLRPSEASGDLFDGLARALCREEALPELVNGEMTAEKIADLLRRTPSGIEFGLSAALELVAGAIRQREEQDFRGAERQYRQVGRIADADEMLRRITHLTAANKIARLVLVIDQLEELFTVDKINPEIRSRFVTAIATLARSSKVYVIATLRSDFFERCAEVPLLAELSQGDGLYHLLPPDGSEIGQMIRQPALAAGLRFETHPDTQERLDERLRDAATRNPEALPLLQFCLEELYKAQARRGENSRLLTHADYDEMGGVEGALAKRAEVIFLALAPAEQAQFNHVMRGITTVGLEETTAFNRRWADYQELVKPAGAQRFVDAFLNPDARLFVIDRIDDGRVVVSATHEALLTRWDRLRRWLEENRENLRMRAQVGVDARRWRDSGRNPDYLYTGRLPLAKAREVAIEGFLDQEEREFVEVSSAKAHAELERRKRITYRVMAAISVALVVAVVFGIVSFRQYRRAERAKVQMDQAAKRVMLARNEAEKLINFMTTALRDKLKPIGRLDLLNDVNQRVQDYYNSFTGDDSPEIQWQHSIALVNYGDVLLDQGVPAEALKHYQAALTIRQHLAKLYESNPLFQADLSGIYQQIGNVLESQGNIDEALKNYEQARDIREKLVKSSPQNREWQRNFARSLEKVGFNLKARGDLSGALKNYRKSLEVFSELLRQDPKSTDLGNQIWLLNIRVAEALDAMGDPDGALKYCHDSLSVAQGLSAQDPSNTEWQRDVGVSEEQIGDLLSTLGDMQNASQSYTASIDVRNRLFEHDSTNALWENDLALSYEDLGNILNVQGDLSGAFKMYNQSLSHRERLAKRDETDTERQRDLESSNVEIGSVSLNRGDFTRALENYTSALKIAHQLAEKDHSNREWQSDLAKSSEKMGDLLMAQGHFAEALSMYLNSRAIRQELISQDSTNAIWRMDVAWNEEEIGNALVAEGDFGGAAEHCRSSVTLGELLAARDPSDKDVQGNLASSYEKLGEALVGEGNLAAAIENFRLSRQIFTKLLSEHPKHAEWESEMALTCLQISHALSLTAGASPEEIRTNLEHARDILTSKKQRFPLCAADESRLTTVRDALGF
jgi:eukaryotic-like serine/threonine-protein kinase